MTTDQSELSDNSHKDENWKVQVISGTSPEP